MDDDSLSIEDSDRSLRWAIIVLYLSKSSLVGFEAFKSVVIIEIAKITEEIDLMEKRQQLKQFLESFRVHGMECPSSFGDARHDRGVPANSPHNPILAHLDAPREGGTPEVTNSTSCMGLACVL